MSKPTIHLITSLLTPIGPDAHGGLETMTWHLADELMRHSWDVHVYGTGDSVPVGTFHVVIPSSLITSQNAEYLSEPWNYRRLTVEESGHYTALINNLALELEQRNGVIHFSLVNFLPIFLAAKYKLPSVTTLHMPLENRHYQILFNTLSQAEIESIAPVGVSKHQVKASTFPIETVYNGIPLSDHRFSKVGEIKNRFIWIGRMVPEKGCHTAIRIAHATNTPIAIAGSPVSSSEHSYFESQIQSQLGSNDHHYPHISRAEKSDFYQAKALIIPIEWEEPFGLTMVEAMAAGTPVIAYDRGAVREIIDDGVTGFICPPGDESAMIAAAKRLLNMPAADYQQMRQACRSHVESNFSLTKMAQTYEGLYNKIAAH